MLAPNATLLFVGTGKNIRHINAALELLCRCTWFVQEVCEDFEVARTVLRDIRAGKGGS